MFFIMRCEVWSEMIVDDSESLKLVMSLTRLSQADSVLCRWIFKRPAYADDDLAGIDAFQEDYAEEDYADEGPGYAS